MTPELRERVLALGDPKQKSKFTIREFQKLAFDVAQDIIASEAVVEEPAYIGDLFGDNNV